MTRYHVIPAVGGGWCVKRPRASRASRSGFADRPSAREWAWGRKRVAEVVLHFPSGAIEQVERSADGEG